MSALLPIVEFKDVSKTFNPGEPTRFTALDGISFRIDDIPDYGEFVAILGPSGCGKSTILNLIQGFSDVYPPTTGEVLVRGQKVTGPGRDRGMIFQRYSSFPHLSVLDNVSFGLDLNRDVLGLDASAIRARAREWCAKVGRDPAEIERTVELMSGEEIDQIDDYLAAGATHVILGLGPPFDLADVQRLLQAARG